MPYQSKVDFLIEIPNPPGGQAKQELADFFDKLREAKIKLRGISGFAGGDQMDVFCMPENADKFRDFLKSSGLRAQEGEGIQIASGKSIELAINILEKIALSGSDIQAFDIFRSSGRAGGFVWKTDTS